MAKLALTEISIKKLPFSDRPTYYWDTRTRGLGVRTTSAAKSFVVLTGSGQRRTIGRYPAVRLADARTEAGRILAEVALGQFRPSRVAFNDAKEQFLKEAETRVRPTTLRDYRRLLTRHFPFGRTALAEIRQTELARRLRALAETPSEHNHAFTAGRAFFRWCVRQGYLDRSPLEALTLPHRPRVRERVLGDDEVAAVYKSAADTPYPFGPIVLLLILTGQRRSEIGALRWEYIDDDTITLPGSLTKNRRQHTHPLGKLTRSILNRLPVTGDYLFPASRDHVRGRPTTTFNGWPKAKATLDKKCGVTDWTLHDLRRTFSSNMAALGIAPHVTEKLLNHVSGTVSGVAAVYNRYQYLPEMHEAVEAWERKLIALTAR